MVPTAEDESGKIVSEQKALYFETPPSEFNALSWNVHSLSIKDHLSDEERVIFLREMLKASSFPNVIAFQEMLIYKPGKSKSEIDKFVDDINTAYKLEQRIGEHDAHLLSYDSRLLPNNENFFLVRSDCSKAEILMKRLPINDSKTPIYDNKTPLSISVTLKGSAQEYIITSIHAPYTQVSKRITTTRTLLCKYAEHSRGEWERPFTLKGAREAKGGKQPLPVHIICGDFNEEMDLLKALVQREVCF